MFNLIKKNKDRFVKEEVLNPIFKENISDKLKQYRCQDLYYYFFENVFYKEDIIKKIQANYLKYIPKSSSNRFLDIGCGRGEFLDLLKQNNIKALGIEINAYEAELIKSKGLDVINCDVLDFFKSNKWQVFRGISLIQVVEHLEFNELYELMYKAYENIENGGVIIIETLNPANLNNLKFFYTDLTHIRPIPPQTLQFLCEFVGFKDLRIVYSLPSKNGYINYALIGKK